MRADTVSGDRTQREREEVVAAFRAGRCRVLVATDLAARGLDTSLEPLHAATTVS